MKKTNYLSISLLVVLSACFLSLSINAQQTKKQPPPYIQSDYPSPRQGGDNVASALIIPSLPFFDNGTTCGYSVNYDGGCGMSQYSPDVVYAFTASSTGTIDVSLCGSSYDNVVYVCENNISTVIACNDDAFLDGCNWYDAALFDIPVTAGNTYYIVVSGFWDSCGNYMINATADVPIPVETPVSNWALLVGIGMIVVFTVVRLRRSI